MSIRLISDLRKLREAIAMCNEPRALAMAKSLIKSVVKSTLEEGVPHATSDGIEMGFNEAVDKGMVELCMFMFKHAHELTMDPDHVLEYVGIVCDQAMLSAISPHASEDQLLGIAYRAQCELRAGLEQDDDMCFKDMREHAIELARMHRARQWSDAILRGVGAKWAQRSPRAYEKACEEWKVPLWSKAAARDLSGCESEMSLGASVEYAENAGKALGLPNEMLLWSQEDVNGWRSVGDQEGNGACWEEEVFDDMCNSWADIAARQIDIKHQMKQARGLIHSVADDELVRDDTSVASLASFIESCKGGRWVPFIVAWANHAAFVKADHENLAPLLRVGMIDRANVGLVCANIDYGSFNARMALIAMHLHGMGRVDECAVRVISARLNDLWNIPAMRKTMETGSFCAEMALARDYFSASAARFDMEQASSPGRARSRQSTL